MKLGRDVYVIGGERTDYQRRVRAEGKTLRHLLQETVHATIADAGIEPGDIEAGLVANVTGEPLLGAALAGLDVGLQGLPGFRVEAACASGGVAVLTAAQWVAGGVYDVVLVAGVEMEADLPAGLPERFGRVTHAYLAQYGLREQQLTLVPTKNYAHAHRNPCAQMRAARAGSAAAGPVPGFAPVTDGGAGVVLCSGEFLKQVAGSTPPRPVVRLLGGAQTSAGWVPGQKELSDLAMARRAAEQAYTRSGLTPRDIDGAEVHDVCPVAEVLAYEVLGFSQPGQGLQLLEQGRASFVNPGGGLLGDGHPLGATGVRQVVEAYRQLTERGEHRQLAGAKRYLTFNVGGVFESNVVMLWGKEG